MRLYLSPRMLAAHLAVLVCVLATAGLGVWQFDAWHTRRQAEAVDLTHRAPVPLGDLMGSNDPFPGKQLGAPVLISGVWLPDATVYVSGREHDGRPGYWVVTPLTEGGADSPAIPVVRGWTPDPEQAPAAPAGQAVLAGWLQPSDATADDSTDATMDVAADPSGDVVPQLQVAAMVQRVHQDLYSGYVVDAPQDATGTWPDGAAPVNDGTTGLAAADLTQLPPASTFTAIRNLFYAVEWWFFGAFAVFVWWRFLRDERNAADAPTDRPVEAEQTVSTVEA